MVFIFITIKVRKKAKIRNQCNQLPHLTQNTVSASDKNTGKHHIQESQEVSPFSIGDHKAIRNRNGILAKTIINNKNDTEKKDRLGPVSNKNY